MAIPIRRRGVGENLALVFSLLFRNFGKLMFVFVLFTLPIIVLEVVASMDPAAWTTFDDNGVPIRIADALAVLVFLILLPMLMGSVLGIVTGSYTGEKVSVFRSIALAARKFFHLALYGILLWAMLFVCSMVAVILTVVSSAPALFDALIMVAMVFFIYLMMCMFFVGMPAIVAEDLGVFGGFRRSIWLTKGNRLGIFGFMILLAIVSYILLLALMIPLGMVAASLGMPIGEGGEGSPAALLLGAIVAIPISLLYMIAPAVIYFQLRAVKENFKMFSVAELVDRIQQRRTGTDSEEHPDA